MFHDALDGRKTVFFPINILLRNIIIIKSSSSEPSSSFLNGIYMCIHIVHMTILYPWVYILIDETAAAVYNFYMMGVVVALVSALGYYPVCV